MGITIIETPRIKKYGFRIDDPLHYWLARVWCTGYFKYRRKTLWTTRYRFWTTRNNRLNGHGAIYFDKEDDALAFKIACSSM